MKLNRLLVLGCILSQMVTQVIAQDTIEKRVEKLEAIIKKQDEDIKVLEKKDYFDKLEFHGYFRTGTDGNLRDSNRRVWDSSKNLIGRWGNEYDTYVVWSLSRKFTMDNGAWSKVKIELENWNNFYNQTVGEEANQKINLADLTLQMGDLSIFTGIFKESVITAGKTGWNNEIVDILDYYFQDIDGTGVGIDKIKLSDGYLNLAYISADFEDKINQYYTETLTPIYDLGQVKTSGTIRAFKGMYTQNDISLEVMYANSPDHDGMKYFGVNETEVYKRDAAADGVYTGVYYKPKNFFGLKGWGQHYLQYSNGVLAGSGLGRLNTVGNMLAHKSSQAYQLGLGGGYNIAEKVTLLSALRAAYTEKMDAREYQINPNTKDEWKTGFADTQREIGLTLRPIYTLNNFVDLWLEAGIGNINYKTYNDIENDILIYKVSVGPQLRYSIGYAETTIRAYVTYINEHRKVDYSNSTEKNKRNDLIAGFQMSAWW